jgi:hypothetical protein
VHAAVALANEHAVPHAPQFAIVTFVLVSQPFAGSLSQLPKPGRHAPIAHVPAAQVAPAFENVHWWPQSPQLAALLLRSVSQPGIVALQSPKPVAHVPVTHAPAEQMVPTPQA